LYEACRFQNRSKRLDVEPERNLPALTCISTWTQRQFSNPPQRINRGGDVECLKLRRTVASNLSPRYVASQAMKKIEKEKRAGNDVKHVIAS
jgi:hypothetical protein